MITSNDIVVCFGDSLTAFGTWPNAIANRFGATVINAGIGGNTSVQGAARFDTDAASHEPTVVILGFGTNDQVIYEPAVGMQVSPDVFESTMNALIDRSEALGAKVILLTPCVVDSDAYYSRHPKEWCEPYGGVQAILERYRDIVRRTAKERRLPLIDIGALSAVCKDDVLGTPDTPDFDGVHPNTNGRRLFEEWIIEALKSF